MIANIFKMNRNIAMGYIFGKLWDIFQYFWLYFFVNYGIYIFGKLWDILQYFG